jgi:hypothetical protein
MEAAELISATMLLDILESGLHSSASEWVFLRELRLGMGHRHNSAQRLDAFALNCLPHLGMKRVCYEVKRSRADFSCELRRPLKRRMGLRYSNEYYFVTPVGLLSPAEIPVECGLIEADTVNVQAWRQLAAERRAEVFHYDPDRNWLCLVTVPAPWRDTPGPTWQFAAAMLRNQRRQMEEKPPPPPKQGRLDL